MSNTNDFDISAKNYDAVFTYSEIGKAQRARVYYFLSNYIESESIDILEINCGTGEDVMYFSKKGNTVVATDISEEMLKVAQKKNKTPHASFMQLDINTISETLFSNKFDLIFSNFGGLNCLSPTQLESFITKSQDLLKPSGKLVAVIMPKHSLWEQFYFSLKGKFREARRRNTAEAVVANVEGALVSTWYFNPKEIVSWAENKYNLMGINPIGFVIPPSYLDHYFSNKQ